MSRVALVPCLSYERAVVRRAVADALGRIPEAEEVFAPGKRVLLKPNLLSSTHRPEEAVNTHPEVVRALAEYAVARGAQVLIGDSCGCFSMDSTAQAIEVTRLNEVARETGAKLLNFDREPTVTLAPEGARLLRSVRVPRVIFEVDALVTVPKFKTHGLTMLTGAVKNLLGLVPGKGKKDVHLIGPNPRLMASALVDLYAACRPRLAVMDAVVGMEGEGPAGGRARHVGCLLAGADAVAMDAVAGAMMGFAPEEVDTTMEAAARGLGVADLGRIEVVGMPLEQARLKDWQAPAARRARRTLWRLLPTRLAMMAFELAASHRATVDAARCRACGLCVENCPVGALKRTESGIRGASRACIACHCCAEVCPHGAIVMRRSRAAALIHAAKRLVRGR